MRYIFFMVVFLSDVDINFYTFWNLSLQGWLLLKIDIFNFIGLRE